MPRGVKNPLHHSFPSRLRESRETRGLSAQALSLLAGIGRATVAQIERRTRIPRLPHVVELARTLGVSPAWLAFGVGSPVWAHPDLDGIGERIRSVRLTLGVTYREIGTAAGCSEGAVRFVERGTQPRLDTVERIAISLGVNPAWLAFGG